MYRYDDSKTTYKCVSGRLIIATKNSIDNLNNHRATIIRKRKREGKQLHGYFKARISEISH